MGELWIIRKNQSERVSLWNFFWKWGDNRSNGCQGEEGTCFCLSCRSSLSVFLTVAVMELFHLLMMNYLLRLSRFFSLSLGKHTCSGSQLVALLSPIWALFATYLNRSWAGVGLLLGEPCDCHRPLQHTSTTSSSLLIELCSLLPCLIVDFHDE